jgi:hypothetical protein
MGMWGLIMVGRLGRRKMDSLMGKSHIKDEFFELKTMFIR